MVLPGFISSLIIQKGPVCPSQQGSCRRWALYSDRESNPDQRFRKPPFYPLNYQSPCFIASAASVRGAACIRSRGCNDVSAVQR